MKFSQLYLPPKEYVTDNDKMRVRIGSYIHYLSFDDKIGNFYLANHISTTVGVEIPGYHSSDNKSYYYDFRGFFKIVSIIDLLDCLTEIFNFFKHPFKNNWKDFINNCFKEEGLGYIMNDIGGIRFTPDEEFEKNKMLTVKGLDAIEHSAVITAFNAAYNDFQTDLSKGKSALRHIFEANEILFKKIAKPKFFDQLNKSNLNKIRDRILSSVDKNDDTAKLATNKIFESYSDWVEAVHPYRHGQDVPSYNNPPVDITILALSNGTSYLRWMLSIEKRLKEMNADGSLDPKSPHDL